MYKLAAATLSAYVDFHTLPNVSKAHLECECTCLSFCIICKSTVSLSETQFVRLSA